MTNGEIDVAHAHELSFDAVREAASDASEPDPVQLGSELDDEPLADALADASDDRHLADVDVHEVLDALAEARAEVETEVAVERQAETGRIPR